jgi:hypothetical protein
MAIQKSSARTLGGAVMNTKFWIAIAVVILVWLLVVGNIASGQPATVGNDNIVITGLITCGAGNGAKPFCPFNLHYVQLTAGRTYMIRMASSDFNTNLTLENLPGKVLACDRDDYDALNGAMLFRPAVTGQYRLIATSASPTEGFYTITIREMPVLISAEDALTTADPRENDCHVRFHDVPMTAGRRYIIDLESNEFAPFVKLLNAEGSMVAFADECGPMHNARVIFEPTVTGTYRLVTTTWGPHETGTFRLYVCEE